MSNVWQARERSDRSNGWTGSGWMNTHDIACSCCSESIPSSAKVIESCGMKASNLRCTRDMRKSSGGLVLDFDWLDLESIWHRKSHVAPAIAPSPLLRHEQKSCGLEHERCVQSHRFHLCQKWQIVTWLKTYDWPTTQFLPNCLPRQGVWLTVQLVEV